MEFETAPPPQWHGPSRVGAAMRTVVLALVPALLAFAWFYGPGVLINIALSILAGFATEAGALGLRGRAIPPALADGSTLVTAVLFGMALPPLCPWWVTVIGMVFAIGFVKHLYGGLGYNLFNPAMAGYALILVSFPAAMTAWTGPSGHDIDYVAPSLRATLHYVATGQLPDGLGLDAVTRATVLDSVRQGLGQMRTLDEIRTNPLFGDFGGAGWEWVGNLVALGGFALLATGIIRWQTPVATLLGLLVPAGIAWLLDPNTHPSPAFHLFSGGLLLGAFFIATDPVSSPTTDRGRLLYGAGVGCLTWLIRSFGNYPDGVAFAVLLMNLTVPLLERWTRPPVYGRIPGNVPDDR